MQKKFKSWALWLAIGALIVFIGKQYFGQDWGDAVNGTLNVLLPVLVGFGIVNNPNSKEHI